MVYLTGDTHGETNWIERFSNIRFKTGDIIIILGDFGFIWDGSKEENEYLDILQSYLHKKQITLMFLDGNHENFELLYQYPLKELYGGKVHVIRPSIFHLMRGQIFLFQGEKENDISIFTMGGGFSIDQARREEGISWWRQEMPSSDEYEEAKHNLLTTNYKVMYVLSHTGPQDTISYFSPQKNKKEQELNLFLQWVKDTVKPKVMYYGHLHMSTKLCIDETILYKKVINLETNEYV